MSSLSRLVLIIWVFVVMILTSSYTASLTTTLTVQQLTVSDINQLISKGEYVGYQEGSFVKGILKRLHFDESKLRGYSSSDQYAEALSRGSQKGGVAAIFDEIPYIKLFLTKYCDKYAKVGPTYNTDGFGFVFRKGSPLVLDVSKAISDTTLEQIMEIEFQWFKNQTSCQNPGSTVSSNNLTIDSFRGLFLITIVTSGLALLIFFGFFIRENMHNLTNNLDENDSILQKVVKLAILFYQAEETTYTSNASPRRTEPQLQEQGVVSRSDSFISSQENRIIEIDHHGAENGISSSPQPADTSPCRHVLISDHDEITPTESNSGVVV